MLGASAGNVTWLVDALVLGGVAFCAAAPVCHRVKEERVDVDGTAGHPGRMIDHRTVHASSLNQETLAHKCSHVRVLREAHSAAHGGVDGHAVTALVSLHVQRVVLQRAGLENISSHQEQQTAEKQHPHLHPAPVPNPKPAHSVLINAVENH